MNDNLKREVAVGESAEPMRATVRQAQNRIQTVSRCVAPAIFMVIVLLTGCSSAPAPNPAVVSSKTVTLTWTENDENATGYILKANGVPFAYAPRTAHFTGFIPIGVMWVVATNATDESEPSNTITNTNL